MPMHIEEMDEEEAAPGPAFKFHYLPEARYGSFGSESVQPLLHKWGFGAEMAMCTFRVEQQVGPDDMQQLLDSFFADREVMSVLHQMTGIRVHNPKKIFARWGKMNTKVVSMSFFNKLQEADCISSTGHIRGRLEEDFEGVPIVNLIREAILVDESELYDTFSESERKEFLLRIFQHLIFGGAANQYEDHVEEYFRVTKEVYKDLLTVRRNDAGDVEVLSQVASVVSLSEGGFLFPKEHLTNFCYVIHDPMVRHVKLWYFGYKSSW